MSDSSHVLSEILDWFWEIEEWIPGVHSTVGEIIFGQIPLSDGVRVYELGEAWATAAQQLGEAYEEARQTAEDIIESWSGDGAAMQFADQWFRYLEALAGAAESAASMAEGVNGFGLQVELMKFMAVINLIMLAVSLIIIIATLIPSLGTSSAAGPGAFATARTGIQAAATAAKTAISNLTLRSALRALPNLAVRALPAAGRAVPVVARAVPRALPALGRAVPAAARALPGLARSAFPRIVGNVAPRRVIARSVADRLAAQALGRAARRELAKELGSRAAANAVRSHVARTIESRLLANLGARRAAQQAASRAVANSAARFAGNEVAETAARAAVNRVAANQLGGVVLRNEVAKYLGVRVAFGAGFMGGGDLLGQSLQVLDGNRTSIDLGQTLTSAAQGAAFGMGMWGGVGGHVIGGAVAGGLVAAGTGLATGTFNWTDVGHGAVQGGTAGAIFGAQNNLEMARVNAPSQIGSGIRALPDGVSTLGRLGDGVPTGGGATRLGDGIDVGTRPRGDLGGLPDPDSITAPRADSTVRAPEAVRAGADPMAHTPVVDAPVRDGAPFRDGTPVRDGAPVRAGGDGGGGPRQPASPTHPPSGPRGPDPVRAPDGGTGIRAADRTSLAPDPVRSGGDRIPAGGDRASGDRAPTGGERTSAGAERGPAGDRPPADGGGARPRSGDTPSPRDGDVPPLRDADFRSSRDGDGRPPRDGEAPPPRDARPAPARDAAPVPDRPPPRDGAPPDGPPPRDGAPPDGPPPRDGAPLREEPPVAGRDGDEALHGAGAERGEDPSPRSIEQGTVRMEEHPDYPRIMEEIRELGFTMAHTDGDPNVHVLRVVDPDGQVIRVEQQINLREGMRFLDLEHELGHVHQLTDRTRFPDGPPAMREVTEFPDGRQRVNNSVPGLVRGWRIDVAEYHVRLQEFIRLAERGVDADILRAHAEGVSEHRADYQRSVARRPEVNERPRWARQHFPDIPALEARANELMTQMRQDSAGPHHPPPRTGDDGIGGLRKSASDTAPPPDSVPPRVADDGSFMGKSADDPVARPDDPRPDGPRPDDPRPDDPRSDGPRPDDPRSEQPRTDDVRPDPEPGGDVSTGGSIRPRDEVQAWEWADQAYDRFRADDRDVADIANNLAEVERPSGRTGFTPDEIGQVKRHLMVDEHLISDYEGGLTRQRFDASPGIAEAWIRLRDGRHLDADLILLEHELAEAGYLRQHPDASYPEAHAFANERYNWERIEPQRTGEDLRTSWGREQPDGDPARLPEGPGRQTGGRIHLRFPGDDGPAFGDREGLAAGESAGRGEGLPLRGGVREDSPLLPTQRDLAGDGVVRGVAEETVPPRILAADPVPVGRSVEAPEAVAGLVDGHVRDLLGGTAPRAADLPYRATWDPASGTLHVHYPDGVQARVVLQVNSSLPPGHPAVLRPAMDFVDGAWRQTEPAGVVLPAHAPPDGVARADVVRQEWESAWRTLHQQFDLDGLRGGEPATGPRHPDAAYPDGAFPDGGRPDAVPPDGSVPVGRDTDISLAALEDGAPDAPVLGADQLTFRDATPEPPAPPRPLTPDTVRTLLADRTLPEPLAGWVREHLVVRADDGTLVPRSAEEIAATVRRLEQEAAAAVAPRQVTAAAVPESQFHGYGRDVADPAAVAQAGRDALDTILHDLPEDAPARGIRLDVTTVDADSLPQRAVARSVPVDAHGRDLPPGTVPPDGGGYRIELSDRATDPTIARAVAHEVAEVSAIRQRAADGLDLSVPDVLRPGEFAGDSRLSPHDLGRLAEVEVLTRMLGEPEHAGYARSELAALRDHLGLRPDDPGAAARRDLADSHLSPDARELLSQFEPDGGGGLRATDVAEAMERAADSRTPEGLVDPDVVSSLIDSLPTLDLTRPGTTELIRFVADALGQDVSLAQVGGGGAKGLSGAPVYLVRGESGEIVAVAKIFPKTEEFVRELSSLQRLRSPEFEHFRAPEPRAVGVVRTPDGPAGLLVSDLAAGRAIDDVISDAGLAAGAERERRMAELTQAVTDTATALAELHTRPAGSGRPVAESYLDFHTGLARRLADQVVAQRDIYEIRGGLRVEELSQRIDDAIAASRQDSGRAALVHGDAHPGNFFWHPEQGVTFIDTPTFHYSVDDHGMPIAAPERDVSNFEQRLAHYGRMLQLRPEEVADLRQSFRDAYREAGGPQLHDGTLHMFGARSVLNKLIQLGDEVRAIIEDRDRPRGDGETSDGADLNTAVSQMRAEIELLRRALGWTQ